MNNALPWTIESLNRRAFAVERYTVPTAVVTPTDEHYTFEFTYLPGVFAVFKVDTTCYEGLRCIGRTVGVCSVR